MRALFRFDEAISPAAFAVSYLVVAGFIGVVSLAGAAAAIAAAPQTGWLEAFYQAAIRLGLGVAIAFALRLLGDIWISLQRANDRLGLIVDQGKARRTGAGF
jgi:hypothetical protein